MSLLEGSSAFSFGPGGGDDNDEGGVVVGDEDGAIGSMALEDDDSLGLRSVSGAESSETAMGDFGGDYGDYLRLLEDDTALGFNPQSDPISDNQAGFY